MNLARNGVIGRPLCRPRLHRSRLRAAASFNLGSDELMDNMHDDLGGKEEQNRASRFFATSSLLGACARYFRS
jgi:hypothetical protein